MGSELLREGPVRSFWEALRPHATGAGSYINAMTEIEEDRVRASYGPAKYERLARIKAEYDPDNVFHHNVNVKPALQPIGGMSAARPATARW